MYLKKLKLVNFKNYNHLELEFSSQVNCFLGKNGTGKTNLLDAVHYLSLCKSYFNNSDVMSIMFEQGFFLIQGEFEMEAGNVEVYSCGFKKGQKKIFKNGDKDYDRLADHIGKIPLVISTPADTSIIWDGSEERRRMVDSIISQYNREYLNNLVAYNKTLAQRNKLLKDFNQGIAFQETLIEVYDSTLDMLGTKIHKVRKDFSQEYISIFEKYYRNISGTEEMPGIIYNSQLSNSKMSDLLIESRSRDQFLEYTSVGVHKDDFEFQLDGFPLKRIGSQGQQKTFLVALRLAEFTILSKYCSFSPLMLLDDVFDKFDSERVVRLVNQVKEQQFGQIFMTDTNSGRIDHIIQSITSNYKLFHIEKSNVYETK